MRIIGDSILVLPQALLKFICASLVAPIMLSHCYSRQMLSNCGRNNPKIVTDRSLLRADKRPADSRLSSSPPLSRIQCFEYRRYHILIQYAFNSNPLQICKKLSEVSRLGRTVFPRLPKYVWLPMFIDVTAQATTIVVVY